jgi:hypothetical protein
MISVGLDHATGKLKPTPLTVMSTSRFVENIHPSQGRLIIFVYMQYIVDRSVGNVTGYTVHDLGFILGGEVDFLFITTCKAALEPTDFVSIWYLWIYPRSNATGA